MITTTLNRIRAHKPCGISPRTSRLTGYQRLKAGLGPHIGNNDPFPFARIVEINGLQDALWCCRVEPQYDREWRLFFVWCCRRIKHLMADEGNRWALRVAERYAYGQATDAELAKAVQAAKEAVTERTSPTTNTADKAYMAAWWEYTTVTSVPEAVMEAANAAREAAKQDPRLRSVWTEWEAAEFERSKQVQKFLRIVTETEARK